MDKSSMLLTVDNAPHVLSILNTPLGHDYRLKVVCRVAMTFVRLLASPWTMCLLANIRCSTKR